MNSSERLSTLSQAQRDRLAFIELRLQFMGELRRQDLVARFDIQTAAASRDFALYKDIAPNNIEYDTKAKSYVWMDSFAPIFESQPHRVLACITQGFGDGEPISQSSWVLADFPATLSPPQLDSLAAVTRAIYSHSPLLIEYNSISNGRSQREIVPFALVDSGLRWHVRAFDRMRSEFRDFVINRITSAQVLKGSPVAPHESESNDIQWTRIVEIELVPHPDQPRPEITALDYGLKDGVLRMKLRAATAGYTLRRWNIDCSPDHSLRGHEHRLWLKDHLVLYGVESANLAPGYLTVGGV